MKQSSVVKRMEKYIYPLVLLLLPLRHVFIGIDFWDTGYNYANFRFFGTEHMDSMWLFSTYLANFVGHLFTFLPGGKTLLGLNIYTGLVLSFLALISYDFLTRELKYSKTLVFLGEVLAICLSFCPTALLYNYLTYLFFTLCVILLYKGLWHEKIHYLFLAGVCLGLNMFVRFPDIVEVSMIVGVWAYAIICKKKPAQVAKETGLCVAGFCTSAGLMLLYISFRYGFPSYIKGIRRLFAMTENATDYQPKSMVFTAFETYGEMLYWVIRLGVFVALAYVFYLLIPKRFNKARKGAALVAIFAGIVWLLKRNMAGHNFYEYVSFFRPGVVVLMLTIAICLIQVFRPKSAKEEKLIAGLIFLVIMITPIGSNTGLYAVLNNLYLALPYMLCMIARFARARFEKELIKKHTFDWFPLQAFLIIFLIYFGYHAIGFGVTFTFGEATGLRNTTASVSNNKVLAGIKMEKARAACIEEGTAFLRANGLTDRELITYGYVPALHFYLDMPPAFNAWSDLLSFQTYVMREKMEKLQQELKPGREPVIILEKKYALYLQGGSEAMQKEGYAENIISQISTDIKFQMIVDFMNRNEYNLGAENWKYSIYIK